MANDGPEEFWPGFGVDEGIDNIICDFGGSLARQVMEKYDIPCSDSRGGELPDLDIKHMDAMQVVKLSLLEESANNNVIYEPVMQANGTVVFKAVGTGGGVSDIYYQIQTGSYKEDCSGVMVVGKNPMAYRRNIEWKPIWQGGDHEIYDTGLMYNNCITGDFNQYCTIVYDDPHLNSAYEDGIDNLYEIDADNPYDTIIGYAQFLYWPKWKEDTEAVVNKSDSAKILVKLPTNNLGKLQVRPLADGSLTNNPSCYEGQTGEEPNYDDGVSVPIPKHFRYESVRETTVDKFAGISGVYIIGREISDLRGVPKTPADSVFANPTATNADIWVSINKNYDEVFNLEKGKHFQVAYEEGQNPPEPKLLFADNSRKTDPIAIPDGGLVPIFYIDPDCAYALDPSGNVVESDTGYILPTSPTGGILVKEIWVALDLDTPSITIYHPDGWTNKAREIAESLEYLVAPLVSVDEPAPIGFNGTIIDQIVGKQDHDPTTAQNFDDTPLEQAMEQMDAGGGMSLTLSFLEADQVAKLSGAIYNYMNSGTGIESTYVCGPNATPELGGVAPNGGIINSIVYSYQDSNSYTISVNAGPMLVGGFAQVDGGPALKITEEVTAKGTILQDTGNNIHYKVHVDGIGDRIAVNMIPSVLRVGDKVSVAIHNNPVEA